MLSSPLVSYGGGGNTNVSFFMPSDASMEKWYKTLRFPERKAVNDPQLIGAFFA